MAFPEKVLIAVDTALPEEMFSSLRKMEWMNDSEIHIVHIFRMLNYGDGLSFNVSFPFSFNEKELSEAVIEKMKTMAKGFLPYGHVGKVVYQCLFDTDIKSKMKNYVNENKIDLLIVATRERQGLFESSFANHMIKKSASNILVLRPEQ
jgi:nucleotide-binding universal stress UspA family protein